LCWPAPFFVILAHSVHVIAALRLNT
jgi:hypothetical protein